MVAPAVTTPDTEKLERLRSQLPAVGNTGYFNAGTNGPLPESALDVLFEAAKREYEAGRIIPGVYEGGWKRNQRVRTLIAEMMGADPQEIALTHSTSEGISTALAGLTWERGDEVITTNLEHPGLIVPLSLLSHRWGVKVRIVNIGDGGGDVVGALAREIGPRTRVLALSHVMWSSGAVMPLRDIADLAHDNNALTVIDAAQAAGQVPVDLHSLGVDAYAIPGQKWLCGPEATGALYVRADRTADFQPTHLRYAQTDATGFLLPAAGANRYEIGEFYGPSILAQEAVLTWLRDEVGLDWAYGRIATLGQRCYDALSRIGGVSMASPKHRLAGLVCFQVAGMTPQEVTAQLYERGFTIRYVACQPGPVIARVSNGWWNTEEEVDQLAATLADVIASA
jgi:L-cysteine/cystine lyase